MIRLLATFRLQLVLAVSALVPALPVHIQAQTIDARNLAMHFCKLAVNNEVRRSVQSA